MGNRWKRPRPACVRGSTCRAWKETLDRGNVLALAQSLKPTAALDVVFQLLPGAPKPLKNRTRIRLHVGYGGVLGRAILLDREEVKPGEEAFIQLRLEEPIVALPGDHFVIRSYSPLFTIGGGKSWMPSPPGINASPNR